MEKSAGLKMLRYQINTDTSKSRLSFIGSTEKNTEIQKFILDIDLEKNLVNL